MHGMSLHERCIIILLYTPIIVITITLEFNIGFKICSTCFYFAILTRKITPFIPLHFPSNKLFHDFSVYIQRNSLWVMCIYF